MWDFETDPEYQAKLDWVEEFMLDELEPLDLVALDPYDKKNADTMAILRPLPNGPRSTFLGRHSFESARESARRVLSTTPLEKRPEQRHEHPLRSRPCGRRIQPGG